MKNFAESGNIPKERRGGDHVSHNFIDKKKSVMNFITSLNCSETHYCRSVNGRKYLPSELNVAKLYKMYKKQTDADNVKESYFRFIFNRNFNLGFGSPQLDMCSTCLEFKEKIKLENSTQKKLEIEAQRAIHKKRAKAFYSLLKENKADTVTLSFDCQKNLPKIPDQETYYRRQLYLYNFTIVRGTSNDSLTKENCCTSYVWTEDVHRKGSNEISSCVYHYLQNIHLSPNIKTIRLFADGCGGGKIRTGF